MLQIYSLLSFANNSELLDTFSFVLLNQLKANRFPLFDRLLRNELTANELLIYVDIIYIYVVRIPGSNSRFKSRLDNWMLV